MVPDIAVPGAFDACLATATPPFTHVIHTASPVLPQLAPDADVAAVLLRPAIDGTTGILASIARHAPSVRRVVLTSSSAAILHPTPQGEHTVAVYDETHWAPADWDEAVHPRPHTRADYAYCTSKVLAERAAWAFVAAADAPFDLVTICNTYTFGPVPRHLPGLGAVNVSNGRIRDLVAGAWADRARPLPPTGPVPTFVDVRDVALAHVRALTAPAAGGERFYVVAGYFSNQRLAAAARRAFGRELAGRLPPEDAEDDFPARVFGFDNAKSRRLLGLEYRGLDESVRDTVASLLEHGAEARA